MTQSAPMQSSLPLYHRAIDWDQLWHDYPVPDVFARTVYIWSADQLRELQNRRFLECMERGWKNGFYQRLWKAKGIEPGDIRSIEDIGKLPTFNSDDIKRDHEENPPFGLIHGPGLGYLETLPLKLQTSGGTTGTPRPTLYGPIEWELNGLTLARVLYLHGVRPGDVFQAPYTAALQNTGWCSYKAAHDYLGALVLTTGSGAVTPSRRQLELAFQWGTTVWYARPEYMTQLAKVCRDELGRDLKELKTKFVCGGFGPDVDHSFAAEIEALWGCPAYDFYGTHEMGMGAFECRHKTGLHLMEDCQYVEVVGVEDEKPVAHGQKGNMVTTIFFRSIPPLIRYNLRDLTRIVGTERCACGSSFRRIEKCLGRSDTMVRIRGNSIWPQACLPAIKSDSRTTGEWLCVAERVTRDGVVREEMTVKIEVVKGAGGLDELRQKMASRLKSDLGVSVGVELVDDGALQEFSNRGVEGKPRRILDKRFERK
jgi:phenylacetate-CoA ligase